MRSLSRARNLMQNVASNSSFQLSFSTNNNTGSTSHRKNRGVFNHRTGPDYAQVLDQGIPGHLGP